MIFASLRKMNQEKVSKPRGFVIECTRKIMPKRSGGYPID